MLSGTGRAQLTRTILLTVIASCSPRARRVTLRLWSLLHRRIHALTSAKLTGRSVWVVHVLLTKDLCSRRGIALVRILMAVAWHWCTIHVGTIALIGWWHTSVLTHLSIIWHLLLRSWLLLRDLLLSSPLLTTRGCWTFGIVTTRLFSWNNVDEEVKHVTLSKRSSDITALQGTSLVVLGVDPGAHSEFGDEDVATLGEEDGSLCRDHLHLWIGLHDLLDTGERKLVDLEIVVIGFEVVDGLLPVGRENLSRSPSQALVDLKARQRHVCDAFRSERDLRSARDLNRALCEAHNLAPRAKGNKRQSPVSLNHRAR